jgi:hypothetical protein
MRQQRAAEGLAFLPAALLDGIAPHQVLSASPGLEGKRDKQQPPDRFRSWQLRPADPAEAIAEEEPTAAAAPPQQTP